MSDEAARFAQEVEANIQRQGQDEDLRRRTEAWVQAMGRHRYSYNFRWLGRPIIQYPQDILAMQELIWEVQPDLIVETGVAHGGSLILWASLLELIGGEGRVVGVDIEIRKHNREAIEAHRMARRITLVEGSSVSEPVVAEVRRLAGAARRVMVVLDSNHTHDHVLQELRLYAPLVKAGSYLVVFDTIIEDMPEGTFPNRPWGKGNNPKTAVRQFLQECDRFVVDQRIEDKLLITVAPEGYLRCVRDP